MALLSAAFAKNRISSLRVKKLVFVQRLNNQRVTHKLKRVDYEAEAFEWDHVESSHVPVEGSGDRRGGIGGFDESVVLRKDFETFFGNLQINRLCRSRIPYPIIGPPRILAY